MLVGGLYERASGAAGRPLAGYRRRTPERTVLYELVAQHAQTRLAELRDALAILDRIVRRLARRLAAEAPDDDDTPPMSDVLAQVQIEAAATWRAPSDRGNAVRGAERLRAWHDGFSLHAGVVIAEHDRDALERLCRTVIAVVTHPALARTLLAALDLPHEPSAFAPARAPPQAELAWDDPA